MLKIIQLKHYIEDTKISVALTKPNAKKCVLRELFIFDRLFRFTANNPDPGF